MDDANRQEWLLRPSSLIQYHCLNLESLTHDDVPDSHWQKAVAAINLSTEQIKVGGWTGGCGASY